MPCRTPLNAPDLKRLPDEALLSPQQIEALTGFAAVTLKKWRREGRGPKITTVEGRPRTTVRDYRAWISGSAKDEAA